MNTSLGSLSRLWKKPIVVKFLEISESVVSSVHYYYKRTKCQRWDWPNLPFPGVHTCFFYSKNLLANKIVHRGTKENSQEQLKVGQGTWSCACLPPLSLCTLRTSGDSGVWRDMLYLIYSKTHFPPHVLTTVKPGFVLQFFLNLQRL